jgi:hypothetical protein
LYTAPTQEQVEAFWFQVKWALEIPIVRKILKKNESKYFIEVPGTKNRIKAKTAWNAETLRGDYGDLLIFDEYQLTKEDAWEFVGAPMLIDNKGDAVFIYTPLSLASQIQSRARDPRHAAKLFKKAQLPEMEDWETFHFSSYDNPHVSKLGIEKAAKDMTAIAVEQELMAIDKEEAPYALWSRDVIETARVLKSEVPEISRMVIGVDPPGGATECGIVVAGLGIDGHGYVFEDISIMAKPEVWANAVVSAYLFYQADRVVGETNYGGDMVERVIRVASSNISYKSVVATRGKAIRAEPVAALYEQGKIHHVGKFLKLEDEMTLWQPGMKSPNRMDALVWCITDLIIRGRAKARIFDGMSKAG